VVSICADLYSNKSYDIVRFVVLAPMEQNREDSELVAKILARDRHALAIFYRRYSPKLALFIKHKVNNVADGEEILQDTLFAFLEAIRDFHGASSIKTFLFSICHHKIIDYYRRRKLKQMVFSQMPNLEALVSPMLNPEQELDTTLLKEKIHMVLERILPHYRQLLVSKYVDNLSVSEVAGKFALSFKSAESQLFRARKAFVELFLSI
jgi:RNA polymerase sigma-70 factor, ECF subfamily